MSRGALPSVAGSALPVAGRSPYLALHSPSHCGLDTGKNKKEKTMVKWPFKMLFNFFQRCE